jgi:hypothetical protein
VAVSWEYKNFKIIDFLNEHINNFEEVLSQEPYCVTTKRSGDYFLLMYSQLNSDFSNPIVRECRGSIFTINNGKVECVCMPFFKFGNYGESYADIININSLSATEKIDGSLIKVWYHNGWHVSTNGTIDAYTAMISNYPDKSFGDVFDEAIEYNNEQFFSILNPYFVYMFELVSPYTRVVVPYANIELYLLSARNMITFMETPYITASEQLKSLGVKIPQKFPLNTIEDCLSYVQIFDKNHEGIVVCDDMFHRVKIKSPEYLIAARAANNGVMGLATALDLIRHNAVDDFRAYCDIHNDFLDYVTNAVKRVLNKADADWWAAYPLLKDGLTPTVAVFIRNNFTNSDYIFKKYREPELNATEYFFYRMLHAALCRIVHDEMCSMEKEKRDSVIR